jgi:putative thioredoxin
MQHTDRKGLRAAEKSGYIEAMDTQILGGGGNGGASAGDVIKDTTTSAFMADVIDASKDALVLVDFWAPWCGPCKQLTPVLEKVVKAAGGAVRLVKLNIDEHPAIPGQMGVQSIPAVFAFKDGRPVDGFMGALPESQIKQFIDRLLGPGASTPDETAELEAAQAALEAGDHTGAAQIFAMLLQKDPENAEAIAGLAKCYIAAGEYDRAEETLGLAPPKHQESAPVAAARAMLALARKSGESGDVQELRRKVDADPADPQARFDLAIALNAAGDREGAVDELLAVVKAKPKWNDGAARKQLVEFFEAWGGNDPATVNGRQRLSSLLFA